MNRLLYIIIFLLSVSGHLFAQERLVLEHRKKRAKTRHLHPDREYYIQTRDTTYHSEIISFTDTTLSLTAYVKTGKDTTYRVPLFIDPDYAHLYKKRRLRDTGHVVVMPLYVLDTIDIPFTDITALKKDWWKKTGWLRPFGLLAAGAVLGVVALPIAVIDDGKEGLKNWVLFEAGLIALSAPPLFIGTRKTKYNLTKKWIIKRQE